MFDIITTNGAAILTMIGLWSTLTWAITYAYMGTKVRDRDYRISVLDWYIYEADRELERALAELEAVDKEYGHIIDDYKQHILDDNLEEFGSFYSDGKWVN